MPARRPTAPLVVLALGVGLAGPVALGPQPASAAPAVRVQTVRLPGLPGASGPTEAYAVNAAGTVVGAATTAGGARHAVVWRDGRVVDLDRGRAVSDSVALDVNSSGHAVGQDMSAGPYGGKAVLWRDGRRTVLPEPTDTSDDLRYGCSALTIDDSDVVGGYCVVDVNGSVNSIPVVWRHGVGTSALQDWRYGRVTDIDADGHLAGRLEPGYDAEVLQAVLDTGSGPRVLPTLGGEQDQAFALNTRDTVVGRSDGRPVTWSGGAVRPLPAPSGAGAAYAVNRWGTVAGEEGTTLRPVAWKKGVLTPLGPARGSARAVNDRGVVVGWSETAGGRRTALRWQLIGD